MSSLRAKESLIFEDETFTLEQNAACLILGYLILRLKVTAVALAQLQPEAAKALAISCAKF